MPIHLRVDEGLGLVELIFEGRLTEEETDQALAAYLSPEYAVLPLGLFDLTGVSQSDLSDKVLERAALRVAEIVDPGLKRGRVAFVAVADDLFELARTYQVLRDPSPVEVKVFGSRRDALRWLGLPLEEDPG